MREILGVAVSSATHLLSVICPPKPQKESALIALESHWASARTPGTTVLLLLTDKKLRGWTLSKYCHLLFTSLHRNSNHRFLQDVASMEGQTSEKSMSELAQKR